MLMLVFIIAALGQPSYMQLESYDQFPSFVNADVFHPLGDKDERALRRTISREIFDALSSQNGESGYYVGCDRLGNDTQCKIVIGTATYQSHPTYRLLRKIYNELVERNITFDCGTIINGTTVFAPFPDIDPYGTMPTSLRLKRV